MDAEPSVNPYNEDGGSTPPQNENILKRKGKLWFIQFQGKHAHVQHSVGIWRLSVLLSSPGEPVAALRLIEREPTTTKDIEPSELMEQVEMPSHVKSETGEVPEMPGVSKGDLAKPPVDVVDQKTIDDTKMLIQDLKDELALSTDIHQQEELDVKIADVKAYLSTIADHKGNPRLTSHDAKKAADAVSSSIKDAILEIKEILPDFAKHLEQSLAYGQNPIYSPTSPIRWIIR